MKSLFTGLVLLAIVALHSSASLRQERRDVPRAEKRTMKVHYLEIVTKDVDAVCAAYAAAHKVQFGKPVAELGNARTATLADGGLLGVRAPLRETEQPVVRPYWLVDDINAAVAAVVKAGGQIAHEPLNIPGRGTFAIYVLGGNDHGLWQL
jgi:predicted enzyme related to lactoylglutathione lyase